MAATGEERVVSELKAYGESLGQIRNELTSSIGQLEAQITALRGALAHARENHKSVQDQLSQVHDNTGGLEGQLVAARNLEAKLGEMQTALASLQCLPLAAPAAQAKPASDFSTIKKALIALTAASGQDGILEAFLDQAAKMVKRAILFANKDNRFEAWRSQGFPPAAMASLVVDDPNDPIMAVAKTRQMVYREQAPAEATPSLGAGGELPNAFAAIPLVFEDYVPVILYADSDGAIDIDYLEALSYLAALVLKNESLRQGAPERPSMAAAPPTEQEEEPSPEPAPPTPKVIAPLEMPEPPAFELPEEESEPIAPPVPAAEDWEIPESMREERAPAPTAMPRPVEAMPRPIETMRIEPKPAPEPIPMPMPKPAPAEPPAPAPAPSAPAAAPVADLSPEDAEKFGNEARRFARLLVSEIKLYNEDEVYNGRQNSDLYLRLKRDVDRSREMYEKRVNPAIAKSADYFHEELIRILAREDASLMGPAYPGPVLRR